MTYPSYSHENFITAELGTYLLTYILTYLPIFVFLASPPPRLVVSSIVCSGRWAPTAKTAPSNQTISIDDGMRTFFGGTQVRFFVTLGVAQLLACGVSL